MKRPDNLKVGDKFRVTVGYLSFNLGEIISLKQDDGSEYPLFWNAEKTADRSIFFSKLEPHAKTVRDAQAGDVVIDRGGDEYLVLERWQNTVELSCRNNFKKSKDNYHFDELEEHFTLKDTPEVDDKTAEAMKLLEKAGYNIEKKNAQPSNCQAGGGGVGDSGAGGSGLC